MRNALALIALISTSSLYPAHTKQHDIILWDLHDVILKSSGALGALWHYEHNTAAFKQAPLTLLRELFAMLLYNLFYEGSSEKYIELAYKYNNPHLAELILRICNAQEPITGTIEIMKELHIQGYAQHIGSNIGIHAFRQLTDPEQYPQLQHIFQLVNLKKSQVVDSRDIRKPNPQFFLEYLHKNHLSTKKRRIIFIDDRSENVNTARALGFTGITFQNPDQLRKDLINLGISLTPALPRRTTPLGTRTPRAPLVCISFPRISCAHLP